MHAGVVAEMLIAPNQQRDNNAINDADSYGNLNCIGLRAGAGAKLATRETQISFASLEAEKPTALTLSLTSRTKPVRVSDWARSRNGYKLGLGFPIQLSKAICTPEDAHAVAQGATNGQMEKSHRSICSCNIRGDR